MISHYLLPQIRVVWPPAYNTVSPLRRPSHPAASTPAAASEAGPGRPSRPGSCEPPSEILSSRTRGDPGFRGIERSGVWAESSTRHHITITRRTSPSWRGACAPYAAMRGQRPSSNIEAKTPSPGEPDEATPLRRVPRRCAARPVYSLSSRRE